MNAHQRRKHTRANVHRCGGIGAAVTVAASRGTRGGTLVRAAGLDDLVVRYDNGAHATVAARNVSPAPL